MSGQPPIETHQLDPAIASALTLLTTSLGSNNQVLTTDGVSASWQYIPSSTLYLGNTVTGSSLADVNINSGTLATGDVIKWSGTEWVNTPSVGGGTVTSVGITTTASRITVSGSPVTSSGNIALDLATTAVTPGSYSSADITVDAYGRITAASNGAGGGGTVTSVAATGSTGLAVGGSPITSSGTLTFTLGTELQGLSGLSATGLVVRTGAGTYASRTLSQAGSDFTITNGNGVSGNPTINLTDVVSAGTSAFATVTVSAKGRVIGITTGTLTTSGDASGTLSGTNIPLTLATTTVVAGSYTNTSLTVDSKGRITTASSGSGGAALTATYVGYGSGGNTLTGTSDFTWTTGTQTLQLGTSSAGPNILAAAGATTGLPMTITGSAGLTNGGGSLSIVAGAGINGFTGGAASLHGGVGGITGSGGSVTIGGGNGGNTNGSGGSVTVTGGNVIGGTGAGGSVNITGTAGFSGNSSGGSITLTAGVRSGTGSSNIALLTNGSARLTIDATGAWNLAGTTPGTSGQVLTSNGSGSAPTWQTVSGSGTVTSVAVSGANGIGVGGSPITSSGTIALSLGAITPTSVAATGTVTGSNLSGTNTGDQTITLTGDVTGSGTASFATTLAASGVTAGSYTNTNITVDSKGRITTASSGSGGGVTSVTNGGQLTVSPTTGAVVVSLPITANIELGSLGVGTPASGTTGEIRATNNITAYYSSDARLKTNITQIGNAIGKLVTLRGVEFDWTDQFIKEHGGEDGYFVRRHDVGVIAQEVEVILPEVVATRRDGMKAVKYDRIVALLIEAIKDQQKQIDSLEQRLSKE